MTFVSLGQMKRAEEEYQHGKALYGGQSDWIDDILYLVPGDFVNPDLALIPNNIYKRLKQHIESQEKGLSELRRVYVEYDNLSSSELFAISLGAAYFGDHELAIDSMEKAFSIINVGLFQVWQPVIRKVRQTHLFKELLKEIGLVDYWKEYGWPDLCRPLDNGNFECD